MEGDRFSSLGMFGAGNRGPEIPGLGQGLSPSPFPQKSVLTSGLGWLTTDGTLVRAIFPARWACIAPSFSFSTTSCEDRHKVRSQLEVSVFSNHLFAQAVVFPGSALSISFLHASPILSELGFRYRVDISFAHHPPTITPCSLSPAAPETAPPLSGGDTVPSPSHPGDGLPGSA